MYSGALFSVENEKHKGTEYAFGTQKNSDNPHFSSKFKIKLLALVPYHQFLG